MHLRDLAPVRRVLHFAGAALLAAVVAAPAFAQALDTPTITQTGGGFFRIDLDVTAGESGTPYGFSVQWMKKSDYLAFGFPEDTYDPRAAFCEFTGEPSLNTDSRSSSYLLGPGGVIEIQMGDLFDETGMYGSYLDGVEPGEYAFRVWANGDGIDPQSGSLKSGAVFFTTIGDPECTQGFWKTHGSGACAIASPTNLWPASCMPMLLGTVAYTEAQLCAILHTPAGGNGLISLAHQLITTKLNGCNGSDLTNVAATIAAADALIGGLVIPPVGAGFIHPSSTSALTGTLDDYNNGIIEGVVSCATHSRKASWGAVKQIYR